MLKETISCGTDRAYNWKETWDAGGGALCGRGYELKIFIILVGQKTGTKMEP